MSIHQVRDGGSSVLADLQRKLTAPESQCYMYVGHPQEQIENLEGPRRRVIVAALAYRHRREW